MDSGHGLGERVIGGLKGAVSSDKAEEVLVGVLSGAGVLVAIPHTRPEPRKS